MIGYFIFVEGIVKVIRLLMFLSYQSGQEFDILYRYIIVDHPSFRGLSILEISEPYI